MCVVLQLGHVGGSSTVRPQGEAMWVNNSWPAMCTCGLAASRACVHTLRAPAARPRGALCPGVGACTTHNPHPRSAAVRSAPPPMGPTWQTGSAGSRTPTDLRWMEVPFIKSMHWEGRFLVAGRMNVYCRRRGRLRH